MKTIGWVILIFVAAVSLVIYDGFYRVDETQQVVLKQLGEVVGQAKTEPGLKMKIPFIQQPNYFPKNLQEWDGQPGEIPTYDKTLIWVDTFARWKIVDAKLFIETLKDMETGVARLGENINSKVRDEISSHKLIEIVRTDDRELVVSDDWGGEAMEQSRLGEVKVGREKIMEEGRIKAGKELKAYGIKLVDVEIKRLNYVESVRKTVYDRMKAERKQMAEKYLSEGQGEAQKIKGDMERELKRITSEAYKKAQLIKGVADAEATLIYAKAYNRDPEFYAFIKSLDVYKDTLGKDSTMILSAESDFFKYLKGPGKE